ncbi:MAG TPA: hypothetical protein VLV85_19400 [Stellaceae bacterium]|nr:hypothetical protein [Stellaceae bacterium]
MSGLADSISEFLDEIARAAWFASCGEDLSESEIADARLLAAAMGFPAVALAPVPDWRAAAAAAQSPDWSRVWWEREGKAEAALKAELARRFGAAPMLEELSRVMLAAAALNGAAALALARANVADEALARVAAGAAAQACHQAALAHAAGAGPAHGFAAKFRLFGGGRWPLGVVGDRLFVF